MTWGKLKMRWPKHGNTSHAAIAGAGLAIIAMFLICAVQLYDSRKDALERSTEASRNTLLVVQRDISRNIELYDLSLLAVLAGLKRPEVMSLPPDLLRGYLFDTSITAQYLGAVYVVDAAGNVVMDSRSPNAPSANFSDRDYFTVHRDNPNVGLYISRPFSSRVRAGDPSIGLTRRIDNPDGSFGGVVLLAIRLEYFHQLLSGLTLGTHGTMALIRTDGTLVMRAPYRAELIGRDLRGTGPFSKMSASSDGAFSDVASIDGVRRYYQFTHLPGLPLIMETAPAEGDIFANWKQRATWILCATAAFGAAFIWLSILFARALTKKARLESELMMLARTDSLTGLYNRRTLDETLEREWRLAARSGRPLSILFVDIDHFKQYNDRYGHQAGDDALAAVARCIADHIRRTGDTAARYGGEEFVVAMPETDRVGATAVAEIIRQAVGNMNFQAGFDDRRVTVSIGVATWETKSSSTIAAVIKAADEALYNAKAAGRNRVFWGAPS